MDRGVCRVCNRFLETTRENNLLCEQCDNERLSAASCARIMAGTGLTYSNSEQYSEENWIKARTATR